MTVDLKDFFIRVGGDYHVVLSRLPSEDMVKRFVRKFPADPSYSQLKAAQADADPQAAFLAAHTMKGMAANLGLDTLAGAASDLTEKLRNADAMPQKDDFDAVDRAYQMTLEWIQQLDG